MTSTGYQLNISFAPQTGVIICPNGSLTWTTWVSLIVFGKDGPDKHILIAFNSIIWRLNTWGSNGVSGLKVFKTMLLKCIGNQFMWHFVFKSGVGIHGNVVWYIFVSKTKTQEICSMDCKQYYLSASVLVINGELGSPWWRHQLETFSVLPALCAGNSPVTGEFPAQRPVTRSFDIFFDLRLNNRLGKQSWCWWFETLWRSLWRHCNASDLRRGIRIRTFLFHLKLFELFALTHRSEMGKIKIYCAAQMNLAQQRISLTRHHGL